MLKKNPKLKALLAFSLAFMTLTTISGCENSANSNSVPHETRYTSTDGHNATAFMYTDAYIPTRCMNGVWYYAGEFRHNTYFAPVFTKKGVVAFCDGKQDQYVPEQ